MEESNVVLMQLFWGHPYSCKQSFNCSLSANPLHLFVPTVELQRDPVFGLSLASFLKQIDASSHLLRKIMPHIMTLVPFLELVYFVLAFIFYTRNSNKANPYFSCWTFATIIYIFDNPCVYIHIVCSQSYVLPQMYIFWALSNCIPLTFSNTLNLVREYPLYTKLKNVR